MKLADSIPTLRRFCNMIKAGRARPFAAGPASSSDRRFLTPERLLLVAVLFMLAHGDLAWGKLTPEQVKSLPSPAARQIDFGKDIRPILLGSCVKCHGHGRSKGDYRLDTRETLLKGGGSGAAVVPRDSEQSYLIE